MENLSGRQLGPYRIIAPLGEGGMAAVYKAFQPSVDRIVALKILPRHYAAEPGFAQRFAQEARVIASLEHPHILPVYDYGEADGYTYLVMRYVEGGTLADRLKGRPLPLPEARRILSQLAAALDYAHARSVVHRDVKPSNVLMDEQGNCLLSDFGIAKMLEGTSHITATGDFLGTPAYASPEQALGQPLDGRSDVYSLGVILYEMLTGRPPFLAETPMAVLVKHIHDPLPLPRTLNPAMPESVERVILKALAKRPEDRYQTAGELAQALAAVEVAETMGDAATRPVPRRAPTRRLAVWGYALLALVAVACLLAGLLLGGSALLSLYNRLPGIPVVFPTTAPTAPTVIPEALPVQRLYLGEEGLLTLEPPPANTSSYMECPWQCTQTWVFTLTHPLHGDTYGYSLPGIRGQYDVRLSRLRDGQQTLLAEWQGREGEDNGIARGPALEGRPGDVLSLEVSLPSGGTVCLNDRGRNSFIAVGFLTEETPLIPTSTPASPAAVSLHTAPHPVLAVGPAALHLAWADRSSGSWEVYAARSTDGGLTFTPPAAVNPQATSPGRGYPALAVAADGSVYVAWEDWRNGNGDIFCARSDDGLTFSPAVRVNDDAGSAEQGHPALAVGQDGLVVLAWQDRRGGDWDIYAAHSLDGCASFSANVRVNDPTDGQQVDPVIGVDGQGRIHVAWADDRSGAWVIRHAVGGRDGFAADRVVGSGLMADLSNELPALAMGPRGSVHLAWSNAYIRHPTYNALLYLPVYAVSTDGGATFTDPRQVSEGYRYVSVRPIEAGLAADGAAVYVALTTYSPRDGSWVWFYRSGDGGRSFSAGVGVAQADGDVLHTPTVAVDGAGYIHLAWAHQRGDEWDVYIAHSTDGGATFTPGARP